MMQDVEWLIIPFLIELVILAYVLMLSDDSEATRP
jgi:hypothetical protein